MAEDPFRHFRIEAQEIVDELGKGVLEIERGTPRPDTVARLLRLAHTLKGAARVVRKPEIAELTHAIEGVLEPYRDADHVLPRDRISVLLRWIDGIAAELTALPPPSGPAEIPGGRRWQADERLRIVRTDAAEVDKLADLIAEVREQLVSVRAGQRLLEQALRLADQLSAGPLVSASGTGSAVGGTLSTVRELRDTLMAFDRRLTHGLDPVDRDLREIHEAVEWLRLVPAETVFAPLERAARDIADSQGKRVVFAASGGEVRLEGHVLATVQAALLQLMRNAVAHGIEGEDERLTLGKSPRGNLTLRVLRHGSTVVFRLEDDGRGVDLDAVRRKAQQRGLLGVGGRPGREDLVQLLLNEGISTAETVSEVSGRGLGLSVAREAADRLGGKLTLDTAPGLGTTVELAVPAVLTAMQVLIVEADSINAAIPFAAVRGCLALSPAEISHTPEGDTIVYDGSPTSFALLGPLVSKALPARVTGSGRARARSAVVIEGAGGIAALGVNRVAGLAQVVFRPLPELAPVAELVVSVALDVDGAARVILNPDILVAAASRPTAAMATPEERRPRVLVVDDSLTTRMLQRSILESAGYEVELASSGEEGLEKAGQRPCDLFLVDIEMPGIDGFTFIEQARANPLLQHIPSILVTSRTSPEDRRRGELVGAKGYIVKSEFAQDYLLELIRKLVV